MALVTIEVKAGLQWQAARSDATGLWLGRCEAMGLVLEAQSLDELFSVIDEATQLLLTDLLVDDELDAFLRARGWRAKNLPTNRGEDAIKFDLPWELVVGNARDRAQHAH